MKKLTIALLTLALLVTTGTPLFAATRSDRGGFEMDGALVYGTGPEDFDNDFGITLGAGYMMNNIDKNLMARLDLSYFQFDRNVIGTTLDYTRIPINVAGRYFFPLFEKGSLFTEVGVEVSFDEFDFVDLGGVRHKESEVNLGVTPGVGIDYFVGSNVSVFALGRYHIISDDYFTLHMGGAFHF